VVASVAELRDGARTATPPDATAPDAARDISKTRWWALTAISVSVLVVGLDLTVLSLALPTIAVTLHASTSGLQWITDAYSLVLAAGILPAGMLGDRFGRKKLLITALLLFGIGSIACAYANSTGELIAFRVLLGVGAMAIMPMSLSVIPVLFGPNERQKAIAFIGSATFLSFPIGPIVGGYLLDHFWWGSVFLINIPVVVLAVIAVVFLLPESRSEHQRRIDIPGVVVSSVGLVALTYGLIKAGQNGWSNATSLATIAAGVLILAGFVWLERHTEYPLVELKLFRSRGFSWGLTLMTMMTFSLFGLMFVAPQYFQDVRGANALGSGLRLLPMVGGMLFGMVGGTRLSAPRKDRSGADRKPRLSGRVAVTTGFTIMAVGLAMGATTKLGTSTGFALSWIGIAGCGMGLAMPSAMNEAMAALSAERSGAGSAVISAFRQVGAVIGVAVLGTIISTIYSNALTLPAPVKDVARRGIAAGVQVAGHLHSTQVLGNVRSAFIQGMNAMLWTCGGIALASAMLAFTFLSRRTAGLDT
jgi:DHA2 family multidrug resistance protein-like MFS transporter